MTRQSLYKLRRKAEGKCTNCGKRKLKTTALCKVCAKVNTDRNRKMRSEKK